MRSQAVPANVNPIPSMTEVMLSLKKLSVFESSSNVQTIRITPSPLYTYLETMLKEAKFKVVEKGKGVGLGRWPSLTYEISKEGWRSRVMCSIH